MVSLNVASAILALFALLSLASALGVTKKGPAPSRSQVSNGVSSRQNLLFRYVPFAVLSDTCFIYV
jgi:hypothetical protein